MGLAHPSSYHQNVTSIMIASSVVKQINQLQCVNTFHKHYSQFTIYATPVKQKWKCICCMHLLFSLFRVCWQHRTRVHSYASLENTTYWLHASNQRHDAKYCGKTTGSYMFIDTACSKNYADVLLLIPPWYGNAFHIIGPLCNPPPPKKKTKKKRQVTATNNGVLWHVLCC